MTGALVISLDFELQWGVRHTARADAYRPNVLGARRAIPEILARFEAYGVAATWAIVGALFAESGAELEAWWPMGATPGNVDLDRYRSVVGEDEDEDPYHYAPSLIRRIQETPRQEIGSHTFTHYFCRHPDHTSRAFCDDLESATSIARQRGIQLRSMVFPRNQGTVDAVHDLAARGFKAYRGTEASWMYRGGNTDGEPAARRIGRLADAYLPISGSNASAWSHVGTYGPLSDVPASRFLRPYHPRLRHLDGFRLRRITSEVAFAARTGQVYHLWWHPHNFGSHLESNLAFLEAVLEGFASSRDRYGMASLTMCEAARAAGGGI